MRRPENERFAARAFPLLSRVVPASFFAIACYGFVLDFLETGRWTSLLWLLSEGLVVVLFVVRRDSFAVSKRPWDWFAGIAGTFCFLLVRPGGRDGGGPSDLAGAAFMVAGTLLEAVAKATLGRSFGLVAANRGVVDRGPYRIVRHPIYLGYLATHVGFLLANPSARNLAVYAVAYFFQICRIHAEERILGEDESYRRYRERVPSRLIPGIF
jgi:hypothetical protein